MSNLTLEERVATLEAEVARLKRERSGPETAEPWWRAIRGTFKNDPDYKEATRLGREYRESLRPADNDETGA